MVSQISQFDCSNGIYLKQIGQLCVCHENGNSFIILSLYIDDILLVTKDIKLLNKVKTELSEKFEMNDTGEASYVLGI